eukprot:TRINITY_DN27012_c0_g1_i1.p1 TRINITY_DN27012_c0_g1~~TRINITY_DN27012_c0_g1_i1.p1  ORF type:complete len:1148 (+),score=248.42 TRINITY_DN27012_c0_g1_i1:73-3516(+)
MMLRAPGAVAARRPPSRCCSAASLAASGSASSSSSRPGPLQQRQQRPVPFLGHAQSARQDVASLMGQLEGSCWVQRLHGVSSIALDLWPPESPHWRVAGPIVIPPAVSSSRQFAQELTAQLSVQRRAGDSGAEAQGLGPEARATVLRALCEIRGGEAATKRNTSALLASLVDSRGVSGVDKESGLAYQLSLEELRQCICALADSSLALEEALKDSPVRDFILEGTKRLSKVSDKMALPHLLALCNAAKRLRIERSGTEEELRRRLLQVADKSSGSESLGSPRRQRGKQTLSQRRQVVDLVASVQALGEVGVLRSPHVREALLPEALSAGDAAELLQHALPAEGSMSSAHEFVVAAAVRRVVAGARVLTPRQIAAAARGALALQARGDDFAVYQAGRVLRALWPRVALRHSYFGPTELSDILWAYWWQLLYSRQELAIAGRTKTHPVLQPSEDASRNSAKESKAAEDLRTKLLRPSLERLGEMPLKQVAACLTSLAPPVRPPDVMNEEDRALLRQAIDTVFSRGAQTSSGAEMDEEGGQQRSSSSTSAFAERWMEDFWTSELQSLAAPELLELACGLREAGLDGQVWPLQAVVVEIDNRLRPSGKSRPAVELSHFLLLRLCRVMDLWHGHEVEEVLKHLLSNPEAVKPLPTSYFVAVLSALCDFAVPKELPLRLVSSFLERVEQGERSVQPEQWAEILRAIRLLDEWPSFDRITPRLLQRLLPHLEGLPPPVLSAVLTTLAAKPFPREVLSSGAAHAANSPLQRIPAAATEAVRKAASAGHWDFQQVVGALDCLGKLGWYSESTVAALLAFVAETPLLEPHAPLMLPLVRACTSLRVHHAPLLHKVVLWYCWCYAYLWPKPLPSEKLNELLELAEHLMELSFQSLELQGVLAENLKNSNASPRQTLALLSVLARFSHFPPEFKETCARVCSGSSDSDLASLTPGDLINAFNVHLCAVFDGPAALKHWLTEDEGMKTFFQVHTSQKWYQKQDQERTTFLQSPAYLTLREAAEKEGLDLRPSEPGEVYHVELVSRDAKERLSALSENPPVALMCIKSKEELRWYVPITAEESPAKELELQNRCHQFRFMFRGAVQKMRHLQAMGYRPAVIWMSEWNSLASEEERRACLREAIRQPGAFRPASAEEEDAYR